jgi:hypothetical protein
LATLALPRFLLSIAQSRADQSRISVPDERVRDECEGVSFCTVMAALLNIPQAIQIERGQGAKTARKSTPPAEKKLQSEVPPAPPHRTEITVHSVGLVRVGLRDMTIEEDLGATMVSGRQFARHGVQARLEIIPQFEQGLDLV